MPGSAVEPETGAGDSTVPVVETGVGVGAETSVVTGTPTLPLTMSSSPLAVGPGVGVNSPSVSTVVTTASSVVDAGTLLSRDGSTRVPAESPDGFKSPGTTEFTSRGACAGCPIDSSTAGTPSAATTLATAKPADLILITHAHGDHMDPKAIDMLKKASTIYVAPPPLEGKFPGTTEIMKNGETKTVGGVSIQAVAAYNLQRGPQAGIS